MSAQSWPTFVGIAQEADMPDFPTPMLDAIHILRAVAHCGAPLVHMDGTASVYLTLKDGPYRSMRADIREDGSIKFERGSNADS